MNTIRRFWPSVVAVLALLALAQPAVAQVTETGTIEGLVQDASGLPIPGATVVASATDTVTKREGVSDAEGRALLVGLAPSAHYIVTTELTGFRSARNENVLVRSGLTATVRVPLAVGGVTEQVQVTAESPIVDARSATTGQDITLELTESLPTGRSYQSYLQLVPGVLPDDPQQPGNPASKSGINYSDIGGNLGVSSDNFYYFNGINVTDPVTGTFGSNLNTEIIQEQKVLTGGIPAEYIGTPGLLSTVITKSGSNLFHGSANYFFQNDALVAENKNSELQTVLDLRRRRHARRADRPRSRLVLRELPKARARRRCDQPRHRRIPAHRQEPAGSGLRQGHVDGHPQRHGELHVPQ